MTTGDVGNLRVKLSLDNAQFERSVASMNRTLQAIGQEIRGLQNRGREWGSSIDGLRQKQEAYSRLLEGQQTKVRRLADEYEKAKQRYGENSAEAERLAVQLNRASAEMDRTQRELNETTAELERQERELAQSQTAWARFGEAAQRAGAKLKAVGDSMKNIGRNMSMYVTAPITALGAGAFKAATDFESAFAGVRKTVDTTEEGFAKLEKGIRDMAKELPASASDIAAVAESAGQLGIAEDKILSFSRTIIDLGESTNMTREQAATEFARFANIVGMSQDNFDRLGSSIVGLGNTMATTESEIMSMGMRLAAQGKQVGMTEAEIMALAGTMSSLGIQAEMGGTAMTTILKKIQTAVLDGGAGLRDFAEVSQMSAEEFKKLYNTSAISALDAFSKGLSTISSRGENVSAVLKDIGIKGIYESDVMMRLSGASELLAGAIDTSSTAWEENTALANEAEQRYATTASQLAMLKNKVVEIAISLGQTLIPMIMSVVDKITPMIEKFTSMEDSTKKMIIVIGGIAAAIGPVLVVLGTLVSSIGSIVSVVGAASAALASIGGITGALGVAFTALTGPIGIAVAAIAGIGVGTALVVKEMKKSSIEMEDWSKGVSEATAEVVSSFVKISDDVGQSLSQLHLTSTTITSDIANEMTGKFDSMYSQIVEGANTKHNEQMDSLRNYFLNSSALTDEEEKKILEKQQQSHENEMAILESKNQIVTDIMKKAAEEKRELTDHERQVIDNINLQMKEDAVRVLSESEAEQKVILEKMRANADELTAQQAAEVVKNAVKQKEEVVAEAEQTYEEAIKNITKMRDETGVISAEQAERMIAEAQKSRDTTIKYAEEMHDEIVAKAQEQAKEHVEQVDWETGEILSKWGMFKKNVSKKWNEIKTDASKKWEEIKSDTIRIWDEIKAWPGKKIDEMKSSVEKKMTEVKTKIESKWDEAQSFLSNISLIQIGKDIVNGLIEGIGQMFGNVKKKVESLAGLIPEWAKDILGIQSPSTEMIEVGKWTGEGIAVGVEGTKKRNEKAIKDVTAVMTNAAKANAAEVAKIADKAEADRTKIQQSYAKKRSNMKKANGKKIAELEKEMHGKLTEINNKAWASMVEKEKELNKQKLEAVKKFVDDKKKANELSLIDEAQYWRAAYQQFKTGSAENVELRKQYQDNVKRINDAITSVNNDFLSRSQKINDDLIQNEQRLNKEYSDAVESRYQNIVKSFGLFDEVKQREAVTSEMLSKNLNDQVQALRDWTNQLNQLERRKVSKTLLDELKAMGPSAIEELKALNSMTDSELKSYQNNYQEKSKMAREQAIKEMEPMKQQTQQQISEMRNAANKELETLNTEWQDAIKKVVGGTDEELRTLHQVGKNAGQGLLDGLKSMDSSLQKQAETMAKTIKNTIQKSLDIHSPSRWMRDFVVGNLAKGFEIGVNDKLRNVMTAGQKLATAITSPVEVATMPTGGNFNSLYGSTLNNIASALNAQSNVNMPSTIVVQSVLDGRVVAEVVTPFVSNNQYSGANVRAMTKGVKM
ncbi:phage tail tape measure protein [Metasolibacillus meyeri]|uniref:phage tail tape measure protein n=1 Tax=Metasolibacillus meyeri TaxID=1071052 RepID=UPI000D304CE2|nr:phage tail tape measure protein [Metasolibacillus meyeri]